ncbi:MAG: DHH family phosphoesterase, partial [Nanoarchaeota archaeon]
QDLRIFGMQTKPLHKVFEYTTSPYIPGVTGDERSAIKFLEDAGIKVKDSGGKFRRLRDLNETEIKNLITAVATRRFGSDDSDELYGPVYIITDEDEDSMTRDAREFSSLLNCCVRMNKAGLAIGTCLGNKVCKEMAISLNKQYLTDLIRALDWFYRNRGKEAVKENGCYVLINAEENVSDQIIGTLCSLISRSNVYDDGILVIGLAHGLDDSTKISARIGGANKKGLNAAEILNNVVKDLGGYSGGHSFAAGATIKQEKEQEFIKNTVGILDKLAVQEAA